MNNYEDYSDEDVLSIAKAYAYQTFKRSIENPEPDYQGHDTIPRHRQNNATKIVGYLTKAAEQDDKAPELGVILQELRKQGEPLLDN